MRRALNLAISGAMVISLLCGPSTYAHAETTAIEDEALLELIEQEAAAEEVAVAVEDEPIGEQPELADEQTQPDTENPSEEVTPTEEGETTLDDAIANEEADLADEAVLSENPEPEPVATELDGNGAAESDKPQVTDDTDLPAGEGEEVSADDGKATPAVDEIALEAASATPVDGFLSIDIEGAYESQDVPYTAPLTGCYTLSLSESAENRKLSVSIYDDTAGHSLGKLELYSCTYTTEPMLYLEKGHDYTFRFVTAYYDGLTAALTLSCLTTNTSDYFTIEDGVVTGYSGQFVNIVVPEGVESISHDGYEAMAASTGHYLRGPNGGYGMVEDCTLVLPATMKEISAYELNYYDSTKSALGVTRIDVAEGSTTFKSVDGVLYSKDGTKLIAAPGDYGKDLLIPEGVETVGAWACVDSSIGNPSFPDTLITIEEGAFQNSTASDVTIPDSVKTIGDYAFEYVGWGTSSLKKLSLGNGVESIGSRAFADMGDTELVLPKSLKSIDSNAFTGCPNLETITFEGEPSFDYGYTHFDNCPNLSTLVIDSNVYLDGFFFYRCPSLTTFVVGEEATQWSVIDGNLVSTSEDEDSDVVLMLAPATSEPIDFVIPSGVDQVHFSALTNVVGINSLTIGKDCTSAEPALEYNLTSIKVVSGNPYYSVSDGVLFSRHSERSSDGKVIYSDTDLDLVRFPMGTARTEYDVPEGVLEIDSGAFANNSTDTPRSLQRVSIPRVTKVTPFDAFSTQCDEGERTLTIAGYRNSTAERYYEKNGECQLLAWETLEETEPEPVSVAITFNGNGSSFTKTVPLTKGDTLGTLPTPTRTGYKLLGWYTAKSGGTKISSATVSTKDATYFAHWEKLPVYKVTFNANGGKASKASVNVYKGYKIGTLPTATRSGYRFLGWYTAKTGGTKISASTVISKSQTVYARWKKRISVASAAVTVASPTYTGSALKPTVTVKVNSKTLVAGTDYKVAYSNNVKASTKATFTITGLGNYIGTKKATFTIKARSVAKLTAALTKTSYAWTGKAMKPGATVTYGKKTLVNGTDYTLSYKNNTNIGTATVTIKGKGNYTGSKALTFKITKATQPAELSATTLRRYYTQFAGKKSMTATVKITGAKESPKITFKSSDTKVAKVEKSLTGYKVTIYRKAGASATANITFTIPATTHYKAKTLTLKVSSGDNRETPTLSMPASVELKTTEISGPVKATATTDSDGKVTYASSNTAVGTVDAKGMVTLTGAIGETTITAKIAGTATYKSASATMRIVVKTPVQPRPDFTNGAYNDPANPYAPDNLNQCTSFAWARVREVYGDKLNMAWTSNGCDWAATLVATNPDKFKLVTKAEVDADPTLLKDGTVYSVSYQGDDWVPSEAGHVGFISKWYPDTMSLVTNDGNMAGFETASINGEAINWGSQEQSWAEWNHGTPFTQRCRNNLVFAVPI